MKKSLTLLATAVFAMLFLSGCQKEETIVPANQGKSYEIIGNIKDSDDTKADYKINLRLNWKNDDFIEVHTLKFNEYGQASIDESAFYMLTAGAGTSHGKFSLAPYNDPLYGKVYAFSSVVYAEGDNIFGCWPSEQGSSSATANEPKNVPLGAIAEMKEGETSKEMDFSMLGCIFCFEVSGKGENDVLSTIELHSDSPLSGKFTVYEDGDYLYAMMAECTDETRVIEFECPSNTKLSNISASPKRFYISVPAAPLSNLQVRFTTVDGRVAERTIGDFYAGRNGFYTFAYGLTFKEVRLPYFFSVGEGKAVYFSKGNLYCKDNGQSASPRFTYAFEENQYDFRPRAKSMVSVAVSWLKCPHPSYEQPGYKYEANTSGMFNWATEDYGHGAFGGSPSFVDHCDWSEIMFGWRVPTSAEWQYLVSGRQDAQKLYTYAIVNSVPGYIFAPDGCSMKFEGEPGPPVQYTAEEWKNLEETYGMVFLPKTGYVVREVLDAYDGTYLDSMYDVMTTGGYWSSTATLVYDDAPTHYANIFTGSGILPALIPVDRGEHGFSVRLVKDY